MAPLQEWLQTVVECAPSGDLCTVHRAIHVLVNIISRAGLKTSSTTKAPLRCFLARFPYVYCVNWTDITAVIWKELHEDPDSEADFSPLLAGISWRPNEPVPMYGANLTEDVWMSAPKKTNLYDQGLSGDRLLDADTIDDVVRPKSAPLSSYVSSRAKKRPAPSSAGQASASGDARPPLARPAVTFMNAAALSNAVISLHQYCSNDRMGSRTDHAQRTNITVAVTNKNVS